MKKLAECIPTEAGVLSLKERLKDFVKVPIDKYAGEGTICCPEKWKDAVF